MFSGWGDTWNASASVSAATGVPPPCSGSSSVEVTGRSLHRTGSIRNIKFSVRFSGILTPMDPWNHKNMHSIYTHRMPSLSGRRYLYNGLNGWCSVVGMPPSPSLQPQVRHLPAARHYTVDGIYNGLWLVFSGLPDPLGFAHTQVAAHKALASHAPFAKVWGAHVSPCSPATKDTLRMLSSRSQTKTSKNTAGYPKLCQATRRQMAAGALQTLFSKRTSTSVRFLSWLKATPHGRRDSFLQSCSTFSFSTKSVRDKSPVATIFTPSKLGPIRRPRITPTHLGFFVHCQLWNELTAPFSKRTLALGSFGSFSSGTTISCVMSSASDTFSGASSFTGSSPMPLSVFSRTASWMTLSGYRIDHLECLPTLSNPWIFPKYLYNIYTQIYIMQIYIYIYLYSNKERPLLSLVPQ